MILKLLFYLFWYLPLISSQTCEEIVDCETGMVCFLKRCSPCSLDIKDKEECGSGMTCSFITSNAYEHESAALDPKGRYGICTRGNLLDHIDIRLFTGTCILLIGSALAAGGGLGGGGIFVPVLILINGFHPKEAVPLSQAMIFGGSLVNLWINYHSNHPILKQRPLIDYDCVLMLEPLMLAGTMVGVFLNKISPNWLIVFLLVITIGYGSLRTVRKGIRLWNKERGKRNVTDSNTTGTKESRNFRKENNRRAAPTLSEFLTTEKDNEKTKKQIFPLWKRENKENGTFTRVALNSPTSSPPLQAHQNNVEIEMQSLDATLTPETKIDKNEKEGNGCEDHYESLRLMRQRSQEIIQEEMVQWKPLAKVALVFLFIVLLSLFRGGKAGAKSIVGIENCTISFWCLTLLTFVVMISLAIYFGRDLAIRHKEKIKVQYEFSVGDVRWEGKNIYLYPSLSAVAGMFGGLLGIGGGMIMGPLLLELGMLPECVQATSATTVLITSGAATFQFFFLGLLLNDYALWFATLGLFSTYFGQKFINYLVRKYNTTSFIVFSIALVMFCAVVLMTVAGVTRVIQDIQKGENLGFSQLCD
eukprot:g373.t1